MLIAYSHDMRYLESVQASKLWLKHQCTDQLEKFNEIYSIASEIGRRWRWQNRKKENLALGWTKKIVSLEMSNRQNLVWMSILIIFPSTRAPKNGINALLIDIYLFSSIFYCYAGRRNRVRYPCNCWAWLLTKVRFNGKDAGKFTCCCILKIHAASK